MKDRTLLIILWGLGIFNAIDFASTFYLVNMGVRESNILIDKILHTPLFSLVKLVAVPIGLYVVWRARPRFNRGRRAIAITLQAVFGVYALLTVYHAYAFIIVVVIPWYMPYRLLK